MNNKKLELIDFSQGIRSTEIQHNFTVLQNQLDKERISVAGSGISYGLNFKLDGFNLTISEGCLINNEGKEVYIDETIIEIEKPVLIYKEEYQKTVQAGNIIYLNEIPYSNNRIESSDLSQISDAGITVNISNMSGTSSLIPVASVSGQTVMIGKNNQSYENIKVDVRYNYTSRRRDIIYIDKNFKIKYMQGITSPSPSVPKVNPNEFTYILGYIEVNGLSQTQGKPCRRAKVEVIKEFRSTRNVYTDNNNRLYLCGTPFDTIKIIHMTEPKNPELGTWWYDEQSNELKVWRKTDKYEFIDIIDFNSSDPNHPQKFETIVSYGYGKNQLDVYLNGKKIVKGITKDPKDWEEGSDLTEAQKQLDDIESKEFHVSKKLHPGDKIKYVINKYDGFEEWVPANAKSYIPCEERFIWTDEMIRNEDMDFGFDYQHFFFNAQTNRNMLFVPNSNALEIIINQIPVHSDQYEEITLYDAIVGKDSEWIRNQLTKYYGYTDEFDPDKIHEEYENIGVGFKLNAPLDRAVFVEARVTQRVNTTPLSRRFQRSATFVNEQSLVYNSQLNYIIKTTTPYRYGENQLEVFLNGKKLNKDIEFRELAEENTLKGSNIENFELLTNTEVKDGDVITYKITTSIYSYDHLDGLLSKFDRRIADAEKDISDTLAVVKQKIEYIDDKIEVIDDKLEELQGIEGSLDSKYIKKSDKIGKENLQPSIFGGIAERGFYETYAVSTVPQNIDVTNVCSPTDFVILYNTTGNRLLQRGSDFEIQESGGSIILKVTSMSAENSTLYLTGIKFNRA